MSSETPSTVSDEAAARARRLLRNSVARGQRLREKFIEYALLACGLLSIVVTISIAAVILAGSYEFFTHDEHKAYNIKDGQPTYALMNAEDIRDRLIYFVTGTEWTGNIPPNKYGILPLLVGTLMVAVIAALIAIPIGLTTAIYLSEYAKPRLRRRQADPGTTWRHTASRLRLFRDYRGNSLSGRHDDKHFERYRAGVPGRVVRRHR